MKTYSVEIEIPAKEIVYLFISACEGGSNYWCGQVDPIGKSKDAYLAMLDGFFFTDKESKEPTTKRQVSPQMIEQAVKDFPKKMPKHFADLLDENADAETGDVFLQLCCFGEVIYG